jgi:hypothetical protein
VLAIVLVTAWAVRFILDREQTGRVEQTFRREAVASLVAAAREARSGSADVARGHLSHAADLVRLAGLAPAGGTLEHPPELFAEVLPDLPEEVRDFDFAAITGGATLAREQARSTRSTTRATSSTSRAATARNWPDLNMPPSSWRRFGHAGFMRTPATCDAAPLPPPAAHPGDPRAGAPAEAVAYVAWAESRPTRCG